LEDNDVNAELKIDWAKLGIDPSKATITAPEIKNFQPARKFAIDEKIPVAEGKGWLLVVE
jgi:hypothetical protein